MSTGNLTSGNKYQHDFLQLCKILEGGDPDTLRCLYKEYSTRRRHRGAQIWTIGTIFIPLSVCSKSPPTVRSRRVSCPICAVRTRKG
jgi:hypothetical protein